MRERAKQERRIVAWPVRRLEVAHELRLHDAVAQIGLPLRVRYWGN